MQHFTFQHLSSLLPLLTLSLLLPKLLLVYLSGRLSSLPLRLTRLDTDLSSRTAVLGCFADFGFCVFPGWSVAGDFVSFDC